MYWRNFTTESKCQTLKVSRAKLVAYLSFSYYMDSIESDEKVLATPYEVIGELKIVFSLNIKVLMNTPLAFKQFSSILLIPDSA